MFILLSLFNEVLVVLVRIRKGCWKLFVGDRIVCIEDL